MGNLPAPASWAVLSSGRQGSLWAPGPRILGRAKRGVERKGPAPQRSLHPSHLVRPILPQTPWFFSFINPDTASQIPSLTPSTSKMPTGARSPRNKRSSSPRPKEQCGSLGGSKAGAGLATPDCGPAQKLGAEQASELLMLGGIRAAARR